MKLSSRILLFLLLLFTAGLFASNSWLKARYEKLDRSDLYWNYTKMLDQPFKHLKITGGNLTHIAYEQRKNASLKYLNEFDYKAAGITASVRNDTLFLNIPNTYRDLYEKDWLNWTTPIRIFSPTLLSVTARNSNLEMFKIKQKNITLNISGKTKFEIESMDNQFDSLFIQQQDSAAVVFEMSPAFKTTESFHVNYVNAHVTGYSILDIGHGQIDSLRLFVSDSAAVLLSGGTMRKNQQYELRGLK